MASMGLLLAAVIGLVVGVLVHLAMPREPGGVALSGLIGISGAIAGWLLAGGFGWVVRGEEPGIVVAAVGALFVLAIYRLLTHVHRDRG
jgi:uncharacterized membrane protein YeaQ/YmgE (transglycosylase-associated protein family)